MAMNAGTVVAGGVGTGLAKEMYDDYIAKVDTGIGAGAIVGQQQVADLCNSFAQTIVAHIQTNAVISTATTGTVVVTSVSAVTVGAGVSGPGAGTSTGSGTGTIA